ncbi:cytochrome P450 [Lentinula aciculospora]|uniref:Cytochrome P450 n=1 Tax=Lentinula aciculospora TaxID=153920 RepID=A0A9W8ZYW7_9AGAR|nr:cytochrome P450 [Lentinula aciculospora]
MVDQILTDPENFTDHFQRAPSSLTLSIIYGWPPILDSSHPNILQIDKFNRDILVAAAPGTFWVEFEYFNSDSVMLEGLFVDVKQQIVMRQQVWLESFFRILDAAWNAASIYSAGAETTSGQLAWFMQAMILYPDTQRLAQEELDRVVGPDRLPTFNDYEHLPYIQAIVKETLRWRGVSSLGLPHRLNRGDYYEGYFLPKDTICFVNN